MLIDDLPMLNEDSWKDLYEMYDIMTEEQIEKYKKILIWENEELEKVNKNYAIEIEEMKIRHYKEWQEIYPLSFKY